MIPIELIKRIRRIQIRTSHLVDNMLGGDTGKVARYQARFAGVVFPGETIVTAMWKNGNTILIDAKVKERGLNVISNAAITTR